MVVQQLLQALLDIQASSQRIRRQLVRVVPGVNTSVVNNILDETDRLEREFATQIAMALGYTPFAMGGLVTQPTLALLGEAGPEMVIPITPKKKRKVTKYQKEWGRQLKVIKKTSRLKNGSYRSGWNRAKEFSKAHKMTKKAMK
jgi:hypothetical protein